MSKQVTMAVMMSIGFTGSTMAAVDEAAGWQDQYVKCCEDTTWISENLSITPDMDDVILYTHHNAY
jgi:hypothetical protein